VRNAYVVEQFERHGFLEVSISDNGTNFTGKFYENRNNEGKDHFTIIKDQANKGDPIRALG
jgi:hypothetical protein